MMIMCTDIEWRHEADAGRGHPCSMGMKVRRVALPKSSENRMLALLTHRGALIYERW